MDIKIAVGQVHCQPSDLKGNLDRIEVMVKQASRDGARFVLFPETVDLGWVNPEAHELAAPVPGAVSARLSRLAQDCGIWIGAGVCEIDDGDLYDSALLIDPAGWIRLKHRKINILTELMNPPYTPGQLDQLNVIDTDCGRIGILICADTFREDIRNRMAVLKPDWLYIPFGWAAPVNRWPEHAFHLIRAVQKTAHQFRAAVIGPNLVGRIQHGSWKGQTFEGCSTVADHRGLLLAQGSWNREELFSITLPIP